MRKSICFAQKSWAKGSANLKIKFCLTTYKTNASVLIYKNQLQNQKNIYFTIST